VTDLNSTLPPALRRALELLADAPSEPDVANGYLDLLGAGSAEESPAPKSTAPMQALWASRVVAVIYDHIQAALRKRLTAFQSPVEWASLPHGGILLDVGCGPASLTASLALAAGPEGLVLGIDRSEAMLARAVRVESGPQIGFLRADAQQLPLRDETVDAVVSVGVLQFMPDPVVALGEMARVLRPGGRLAVVVPIVRHAVGFWRRLPSLDPNVFAVDEVGGILEDRGLVRVRTKNFGSIQWVCGERG
jgi:arsenite methyltransferase